MRQMVLEISHPKVRNLSKMDVAASKFFVTGVKDLSTGVKYMDSKVDFWFYSYRGGEGAKCVEVLCVEGGRGGQNV